MGTQAQLKAQAREKDMLLQVIRDFAQQMRSALCFQSQLLVQRERHEAYAAAKKVRVFLRLIQMCALESRRKN